MMDGNAIKALFNRYYRPLCLLSLHYTYNPAATEDIVQECFVSLLDKSPENPKAYLYTSVRNRSLSWLQRNKPGEPLPEDIPAPEEEESVSFYEARLWTAIENLTPRRRLCLLMAKRDGMSYKEIAAELGISENTVRNNISKALESLRDLPDNKKSFVFLFF
jgi:RNA polymerase sigma-70 factor (ECF subfamily)